MAVGLSPAPAGVGAEGVDALALVVPGDVDAPTGGNVWDRRVRDALGGRGCRVTWLPVDGTWPLPSPAATAELDRTLAQLPDGAAVLLDGLVAGGVPDVVVRHASRLRTGVVVHLPLALETGLDPLVAARLEVAERVVLGAVDVVVTTSRWTAERLAPAGLRRQPVVAAPGTDRPPQRGATPRFGDGGRLLCVGSITPRKGQRLLLRALAGLVGPSEAPWSLRLVGTRPDQVELEALRSELHASGLGDRVELTGPLVGDDLEQRWWDADLLVLPSYVETWGMVVTEALVRGLPVLSTSGSAVPEAMGTTPAGPPGLLVPPGDVDALRAALRAWLTEPDLRAELSRRAGERGEQLGGWQATADAVALAFAHERPGAA
jgi:glycosyltransferase involved in cell wall biosynthesis